MKIDTRLVNIYYKLMDDREISQADINYTLKSLMKDYIERTFEDPSLVRDLRLEELDKIFEDIEYYFHVDMNDRSSFFVLYDYYKYEYDRILKQYFNNDIPIYKVVYDMISPENMVYYTETMNGEKVINLIETHRKFRKCLYTCQD